MNSLGAVFHTSSQCSGIPTVELGFELINAIKSGDVKRIQETRSSCSYREWSSALIGGRDAILLEIARQRPETVAGLPEAIRLTDGSGRNLAHLAIFQGNLELLSELAGSEPFNHLFFSPDNYGISPASLMSLCGTLADSLIVVNQLREAIDRASSQCLTDILLLQSNMRVAIGQSSVLTNQVQNDIQMSSNIDVKLPDAKIEIPSFEGDGAIGEADMDVSWPKTFTEQLLRSVPFEAWHPEGRMLCRAVDYLNELEEARRSDQSLVEEDFKKEYLKKLNSNRSTLDKYLVLVELMNTNPPVKDRLSLINQAKAYRVAEDYRQSGCNYPGGVRTFAKSSCPEGMSLVTWTTWVNNHLSKKECQEIDDRRRKFRGEKVKFSETPGQIMPTFASDVVGSEWRHGPQPMPNVLHGRGLQAHDRVRIQDATGFLVEYLVRRLPGNVEGTSENPKGERLVLTPWLRGG